MLEKGAVFKIRGVAVACLELYGWEQVDSKWIGQRVFWQRQGASGMVLPFSAGRQPNLHSCAEAGPLAGRQFFC